MADLSDVEAALAGLVLSILNPPGAVAACGAGARVYRGWPMTAALDADLRGKIVNVSIAAVADTGRDTTRWGFYSWASDAPSTLAIIVDGNTAEVLGTPREGDLAGVLVGGQAYVYQARAGDSAGLVAAALCDLIRADRTCWLSDVRFTIPGVGGLVGRTGSRQRSTTELGRQEQDFRVAVWAPTPALRDSVCGALGAPLAQTAFLSFDDGSAGRMRYRNTASIDDGEAAGVYRRDLIYNVDYATTVTQSVQTMLFGDLDCNAVTTIA